MTLGQGKLKLHKRWNINGDEASQESLKELQGQDRLVPTAKIKMTEQDISTHLTNDNRPKEDRCAPW